MGPDRLQREETGRKTVFAQPLVPGDLVRKNVLHVELGNSDGMSSTKSWRVILNVRECL